MIEHNLQQRLAAHVRSPFSVASLWQWPRRSKCLCNIVWQLTVKIGEVFEGDRSFRARRFVCELGWGLNVPSKTVLTEVAMSTLQNGHRTNLWKWTDRTCGFQISAALVLGNKMAFLLHAFTSWFLEWGYQIPCFLWRQHLMLHFGASEEVEKPQVTQRATHRPLTYHGSQDRGKGWGQTKG